MEAVVAVAVEFLLLSTFLAPFVVLYVYFRFVVIFVQLFMI